MAGLSFKHIYKVYDSGTKAVNDFCLEIKDGEFVVFVGPSGCGKSTTLRMIAGLEEISNGELYIDNKMVNYVEPKNRDIAMVFQNYALYPHLNVYENIAFGLRLRHMKKEEIDERVQKAASMLGLTEYLKSKPGAMSGGQRQRVALGRALVREPKVFLLDEPLSNLDAKLRSSMRDEITKLHRKLKTTFVYVTHDQVEAMTMGDRIVVMKLGYVQQIDTPKDLYRYPANKFVAGFIGTPQMNFTDVTLLKKGDKVTMSLVGTDTKFELPFEYFYKVDPKYLTGEKVTSFALRSEYISSDPKAFPYRCKVKIANVEELGTESLVYANFDLNKDTSIIETDGNETVRSNIAFKVNADYEGKADEVIDISLDLSMIHLFDNETENVINPRVPDHSSIRCKVKNNVLDMMGEPIKLSDALKLNDDEYVLSIPLDAVKENSKGYELKVTKCEKVKDEYLLTLVDKDNVLFLKTDKEYKENSKVKLEIDLKKVDFAKNEEIVKARLPEYNQIMGMCYYHKEKLVDENGKKFKKKILDYIIDDVEISISNPVAYRTFIENNDRSLYDIDLGFRFKVNEICLSEEGQFLMKAKEVLEYRNERILRCEFKGNDIFIHLENEQVNVDEDVRVKVDFESAEVFNLERDIRLV